MRKAFFADASPAAQLVFTAFVMLVSMAFFLVLGVSLAIPLFGLDPERLQEALALSGPENAGLSNWLQTLNAIGFFLVPALASAWLLSARPWHYLGLDRAAALPSWLWVLAATLGAMPAVNWLLEWNMALDLPDGALEDWLRQMEDKATAATLEFLDDPRLGVFLFNLFMIALLPALGEELLFRGVFQRVFVRWSGNAHAGVWMAALLFSAMHFQFYGFVPRLLLGSLFGYMLVWSGSMWLPIFAHLVNNATAVFFYYQVALGRMDEQANQIGMSGQGSWMVIPSVLMVAASLWMIRRAEAQNARRFAQA